MAASRADLVFALSLSEHPDQHRPHDSVLLGVDQKLSERSALGVGPEFPDPLDALEVGEHQDVEEFGACGLGEGVEARLWPALELVWTSR